MHLFFIICCPLLSGKIYVSFTDGGDGFTLLQMIAPFFLSDRAQRQHEQDQDFEPPDLPPHEPEQDLQLLEHADLQLHEPAPDLYLHQPQVPLEHEGMRNRSQSFFIRFDAVDFSSDDDEIVDPSYAAVID